MTGKGAWRLTVAAMIEEAGKGVPVKEVAAKYGYTDGYLYDPTIGYFVEARVTA